MKKEEEDILYVYTPKKCKKHCSINHPKKAGNAHFIRLRRKKENIKINEKGRGG